MESISFLLRSSVSIRRPFLKWFLLCLNSFILINANLSYFNFNSIVKKNQYLLIQRGPYHMSSYEIDYSLPVVKPQPHSHLANTLFSIHFLNCLLSGKTTFIRTNFTSLNSIDRTHACALNANFLFNFKRWKLFALTCRTQYCFKYRYPLNGNKILEPDV